MNAQVDEWMDGWMDDRYVQSKNEETVENCIITIL